MVNKKTSRDNPSFRQRTHERFDKMMDKAESMNESGREAMARLKDKVLVMRENFDNSIERNPEKSVLIAAGAGLALGLILATVMIRRR